MAPARDGFRHDAGDCGRRAPVGFVDPGGVDLESGCPAAAVAEVAGDGAQVDADGDEFRGRVVAERVQPGAAQLELARHPPVSLCK